jgi:hypothetical protein
MKNAIHLLAWFATLTAGARAAQAAPPAEPTTGKVLILDNERTVEGDVERVGTQYRVRRALGEVWFPGERVLRLCPNAVAAYEYLQRRANLNDGDERLRLAEWCRDHGLREQALAEVKAAVQLRPQHGPSRRLLEHLAQAQSRAEAPAKPRQELDAPAAPVDLTADAMGLFATRVQPILMNTCAGCHASDKGGKFKLTWCYEAESLNHKVLQQNLAAVLAQVNPREPRSSPFLTKAVSVHGSLARAPLKGRQAPAYRALEDWVKLALANNPSLHESSPGTPAELRASARSEAAFAEDADTPPTPPGTPPAAPPAKAAAPDPFDPAVFNRQAHPEKQPTTPAKP